MQDNYQDFDLQLRSMLEDAEIRPPRGSWKNISGRLDAASAHSTGRAVPGIMRWAGAAVAFAAVALGVFLAVPDSGKEPLDFERGVLMADNVQLITPDIERAAALGDGRMHASTGLEEVKTIPVPDSIAEETTDGGSIDGQNAKSAGQGRTSSSPRSRKEYSYSWESSQEDPFAMLEEEENKHRRGFGATFLYAKGAIGGNDPDFVGRSASISMAPGVSSSGITELSESTYGIPLSLGLGIRFYLLPRLSIGTGVDYSLLTRTFTGTYTGPDSSGQTNVTEAGNVQHMLQYIGIPADLYFDILESDKIKFYVYGGGEVEFCISNKYTVFSSPKISCTEPVKKLQYSVGGGVGVEFRLADKLGLYLDPGIKYYFPDGQPKSIRTDKPVMFNFDAGLRFSL